MKKIQFIPLVAVLSLGLVACSKPETTTNTTSIESNTVIEDTDANLSAVDGLDATNGTDVNSIDLTNTTTNTL